MSVEIEGFEDVADQLPDESAVSFDELFTPDFMRTYTDFDSIAAFFESSPWTVETEADFESIPATEFDQYVAEHTGFDSWETMLSVATREWLSRRLSP